MRADDEKTGGDKEPKGTGQHKKGDHFAEGCAFIVRNRSFVVSLAAGHYKAYSHTCIRKVPCNRHGSKPVPDPCLI